MDLTKIKERLELRQVFLVPEEGEEISPFDIITVRDYEQMIAEIERLQRLENWLTAFDAATEALPVQHEQPSMGVCTYNWHKRVIRDAKAALDGEPLEEGCIYATYANYPAAQRRRAEKAATQ